MGVSGHAAEEWFYFLHRKVVIAVWKTLGTLAMALMVAVSAGNEAPASDAIVALKKERLAAAAEYNAREQDFLAGRGTLEFLLTASHRLLVSQLELTADRAEQLKVYSEHQQRLLKIEKVNKERLDAGLIPIEDYESSRYHRVEAEIWLEQAKAKKDRGR